jgi:hypothetical protein
MTHIFSKLASPQPLEFGMLAPFKHLRVLSVSLYTKIEELILKLIDVILSIFPDPINVGMPIMPKFVNSPPFRPLTFDVDLTNFYWFDFVNDPRSVIYTSKRFPDIMQRGKDFKYFMDIFLPANPFDVKDIIRQTFEGPEYNPISFYIVPFRNMTFLPDLVDKYLYLGIGEYYDNELLHWMCGMVAGVLCVWGGFSEIRNFIAYAFISINPYASLPTAVLWRFYEPWVENLTPFAPKIFKLPTHYIIVLAFAKQLENKLLHLVFTMPYGASQGVLKTETIKGKQTEGLFFEGFPYGWKHFETVKEIKERDPVFMELTTSIIPNHERLHWFFKRKDILQYVSETFNIEVLPDHLKSNDWIPEQIGEPVMKLIKLTNLSSPIITCTPFPDHVPSTLDFCESALKLYVP